LKFSVLGAGAWGTTFASLLADRAETTIWALEPEVAEAINQHHENPVYLPGGRLALGLRASTDLLEVVAGTEAVAMAVPSQFYRSVLEMARDSIPAAAPFLSLSKGIEEGSLKRMSQVATEVLGGDRPGHVGVLSGPNIAREVLAGHPSATVIALRDEMTAVGLQQLLTTATLRVYTNADVVGCEVGGSVKNVIAIAAGMALGLGYGQNTLAALITRGLAELTRLGVALGGKPLTFLGLAGIGDLSVTCHSPDSRNHHVGVELGRGRKLADVLGEMHSVAEGVRSSGPVLALAREAGVDLPICEQVVAVLEGCSTPRDAVAALLGRAPTDELHGIRPAGDS
jgi:glycerol-3-phosphate dehydrogenase (NAD(P)+)